MIFIYAAGIDRLIGKLEQNDQLAVRRDINRSSLAMIRERPFTGWGLNTYVPVYRMFALYDDGTYVNRAHNDWLQFLAEGGILFAAPYDGALRLELPARDPIRVGHRRDCDRAARSCRLPVCPARSLRLVFRLDLDAGCRQSLQVDDSAMRYALFAAAVAALVDFNGIRETQVARSGSGFR